MQDNYICDTKKIFVAFIIMAKNDLKPLNFAKSQQFTKAVAR